MEQHNKRKWLIISVTFATVLQTILIVLLTLKMISGSKAVPILAVILLFGLIPAAAHLKQKE